MRICARKVGWPCFHQKWAFYAEEDAWPVEEVFAAVVDEPAFFFGRLRPQATRTVWPPISTLLAHRNAASSAAGRLRKLTKAHLDAATSVMDLIWCGWRLGTLVTNHVRISASVMVGGKADKNSEV